MATEIGKLFALIGADTSEFDRKVKGLGTSCSKLGKSLTMKLTVPILAIGGMAVKTFAGFETSLLNAATVAGATGDKFKRMENLARTMGETTVFSAKQSADALYYMASAGWKVEQMEAALADTLSLAIATNSDLAFTTETVISTINMFGLTASDAGRVADTFAGAISNSQATLDRLGTSMTYIGPVAKLVNWSLEETTAALGKLYDAGVPASTAGTSLAQAMTKLADPMKKAREAMERIGVTYDQINPQTRSLAEIIEALEGKTINLQDAIHLFGQRGLKGILPLIEAGSKEFRRFTEEISESGKSMEMQKRMQESFANQIKIVGSMLQEAAIQIGEILIPVLRKLIDDHIKPAIEWFKGLSEGTKRLIVKIAVLAAAAGPIALAAGQFMKLASILGKLKLSIAGPGGIIAIIAILGTHLYKLSKHTYEALTGFKRLHSEATKAEKDLGRAVGWRELIKKARETGVEMGAFTKRLIKNKHDIIKTMDELSRGEIKNSTDLMALYTAMQKIAEEEQASAEEARKKQEKLEEIFRKEKETQEGLSEAIKTTTTVIETQTAAIGGIIVKTSLWRTAVIDTIEVLEKAKSAMDKLAETAVPAARNMANVLKNAVGEVEDRFYEGGEKIKETTKETTGTIIIQFQSMTERIIDFTRDLADGFAGIFVDILGITESITYQMKEFDNSYWENAMRNAQEAYEDRKSLLEKQLEDAAGYYEDIEAKLTGDYEKRKQWIEKNVTDEEKKQEMLLKLEQKHQADLEKARADQLQKEQELQNSLVELEENHQIESERIRAEEDAAREQHAIDEEERQNSLWNKVKTVFGQAVDDMLQHWMTDFIQKILLSITDVAGSLVEDLGSAFKKIKTDATDTGTKVGSALGGIGKTIAGIGKGLGTLITSLAKAIATAAETLAASAPALLIVLGIALAAYAAFKLVGSLFKKKPETGSMEAILRDISHIQLAALLDKIDTVNQHLSDMFPKWDYGNHQLELLVGYSKQACGLLRKMLDELGTPVSAQTGLSMVATKPTTIMAHAGEAVNIQPVGRSASNIPAPIIIHNEMEPVVIQKDNETVIEIITKRIWHGNLPIPASAIKG